MNIRTLSVGMLGTQCSILWEEDRDDCLVVDPGAEAERIRTAAGGRRIAGILLTHGHFDHIGAVGELMTEGTRLLIHPLDAPMLSDPERNAGWGLLHARITAPPATDSVREGDHLTLAGIAFEVLHTPGHTPGSVCYAAGHDLFTGDTLFRHGWGRTDLPGGSEQEMMRSLRRLIRFSKDYVIHPGHEG